MIFAQNVRLSGSYFCLDFVAYQEGEVKGN